MFYAKKLVHNVSVRTLSTMEGILTGKNLDELYMKWIKDPFSIPARWDEYFRRFLYFEHQSKSEYVDLFTEYFDEYVDEMYNKWLQDPKSVDHSWSTYFNLVSVDCSAKNPCLSIVNPYRNMASFKHTQQVSASKSINRPDITTKNTTGRNPIVTAVMMSSVPSPKHDEASLSPEEKSQLDAYQVYRTIQKYRDWGHFLCELDPLKLKNNFKYRLYISDRAPKEDFHSKDLLSKKYLLPENTYLGTEKSLTLEEIIKRCKSAYCKNIGVEYNHMDVKEEVQFIRQKIETPGIIEKTITKEEKLDILTRLTHAHGMEAFLSKKWQAEKRFGLEGNDTLIPVLKALIEKSVDNGVEYVILGISHRGRLNCLANVCHCKLSKLLMQFMTKPIKEKGSGDVKYHLGISTIVTHSKSGKKYTVSMVANPSHLEMVNPVVMGKTKAEQMYKNDPEGDKVMAIIMHGDASFAGEGIVQESLNFSRLNYYNPKGVIHIIINNQVGFTTNPNRSRSGVYSSEIAKFIKPPIFHVNNDCPEDCVYVGLLCAEYRKKFKKDAVIDLIGYRLNGHNEADEPKFTQPLMYHVVKKHTPVLFTYSKKLIDEKITTEEAVKKLQEDYDKMCEEEYKQAEAEPAISLAEWNDSPWDKYIAEGTMKSVPTGIPEDVLKHIAEGFCKVPDGFEVHSAIKRILRTRTDLTSKRQMDWAMGEAFAIGSLLKEGIPVRLTGQDTQRGTFSHRHHVLFHQTQEGVVHIALKKMFPGQAEYTVTNSPITENAAVGFELGFSLPNPNALVIWEAQFGDFANMAQPMVDTFITAAEPKWARQTGLVMLLPHGMEGQGPEHSSARVERYLELCDDDEDVIPEGGPLKHLENCNWIVANCSTPANLCHIWRRQIALPFRKALILFTPKSLLRHPLARSSWDDLLPGTEFQRLIPDSGPASKNPENVKKLIFCVGKVYYEIFTTREEKKLSEQIAVSRIEQISPFPYDLFKLECEKYPKANIFFCQEEPKNQGAYHYLIPRMRTAIGHSRNIGYIGRMPSAAPSCGNKIIYKKENEKLKNDILAL